MIKSVRVNMNDDGCEQKKRIGTNIIHGREYSSTWLRNRPCIPSVMYSIICVSTLIDYLSMRVLYRPLLVINTSESVSTVTAKSTIGAFVCNDSTNDMG